MRKGGGRKRGDVRQAEGRGGGGKERRGEGRGGGEDKERGGE